MIIGSNDYYTWYNVTDLPHKYKYVIDISGNKIMPTNIKVKRWLWVYRDRDYWYQSFKFLTYKEAGEAFTNTQYKKLEYTETEFDE